jgi:putative Ca2+/H+ antiporter (TMEM165/GDT1 family)
MLPNYLRTYSTIDWRSLALFIARGVYIWLEASRVKIERTQERQEYRYSVAILVQTRCTIPVTLVTGFGCH